MLLSEMGGRVKRVFSVFASVVLVSAILPELGLILGDAAALGESLGVGDIAKLSLKIVGVGYVFSFVSDSARELSEPRVADAVLSAGRIEILVLIYPSIKEILEMGVKLLS